MSSFTIIMLTVVQKIDKELLGSLVSAGELELNDNTRWWYNALMEAPEGMLEVTWKATEGRWEANKTNLFSIPGWVRGKMCDSMGYQDVDMVACHPTLVAWMLRRMGKNCLLLEEFLRDRRGLANKMGMAEKDLKEKVISAFNYEECPSWDRRFVPLWEAIYGSGGLAEEQSRMEPELFSAPLKPRKGGSKRPENKRGRLFNRVLMKHEGRLLGICQRTLASLRVDVVMLCHDGFQVSTPYPEGICETLGQACEEAYGGLGMRFALKPHVTVNPKRIRLEG